jgi:hypothetical protein
VNGCVLKLDLFEEREKEFRPGNPAPAANKSMHRKTRRQCAKRPAVIVRIRRNKSRLLQKIPPQRIFVVVDKLPGW